MTPKRRVIPLFVAHLGCPHTCVFCDQRGISGEDAPATGESVARALARLDLPKNQDPAQAPELAFYGGSFTAIDADKQLELLRAAKPALDAGAIAGIRVSTRPDAIDGARLDLLAAHGVKTVELGAQSMDDAVLSRCERGHCARDTRRAAALVRARGFELILQMMTGLPGDTDAGAEACARELVELKPKGVRIYPTVVLRGTQLHHMLLRGESAAQSTEDAAALCARLFPLFDDAGIAVIRMGLNPSEALAARVVAGAYHPAFGELALSALMLNRALDLLANAPRGGKITLGAHPSDLSAAVGHKRRNLERLRAQFAPADISIKAAANTPRRRLVLL